MTNPALKIVVLGKGNAGKTSLLIRYATGEFPGKYVPSVFDNEVITQTMDEGDDDDGTNGEYDLGLWDTGGGEDYDRLRPLSYPQTDVFLLCFPVDQRHMFQALRYYWKPEIQHHMPETPFVVVAMKTDLRSRVKGSETGGGGGGGGEPNGERIPLEGDEASHLIFEEEGLKEAESLGAANYVECSALLGEGVTQVFKAAIKAALRFPQIEKKKKRKCTLL